MRMSRAFAVMLAAVLMAVASLAGAVSPASAVGTPKTTEVRFDASSNNSTGYGDSYVINADVFVAGTQESVTYGTATLNTRPIGATAWTPLKTTTYASVFEFIDLAESFEYQVVYNGYTATNQYQNSYTASASPIVRVDVTRGVKYIQKSAKKWCGQVGPLSAPYKNKPIFHFYKIGKSKKWKKGYTVRTNKKSQYCYKVTKTGKMKKVKVPKGPKLKASKTVYVKSGGMKKHVEIYKFTS